MPTAESVASTVTACWRYPVKSLQGLDVPTVDVGPGGLAGDRTHALVDPETGHLLSAKRFSKLLLAAATDDTITLPNSDTLAIGDPGMDAALSAWLGRSVHLASLDEAGQRSYEMTFDPPDDDADYFEIPAPPGTFLDLAHVHLLTEATLAGCAAARPDLDWSVRRFRPNLVLAVPSETFDEGTWGGRELHVGEAVLRVTGGTVRCAMPLRAQPDGIEREPGLFQAINELNKLQPNHLGAYAEVITPGRVSVGDTVELH